MKLGKRARLKIEWEISLAGSIPVDGTKGSLMIEPNTWYITDYDELILFKNRNTISKRIGIEDSYFSVEHDTYLIGSTAKAWKMACERGSMRPLSNKDKYNNLIKDTKNGTVTLKQVREIQGEYIMSDEKEFDLESLDPEVRKIIAEHQVSPELKEAALELCYCLEECIDHTEALALVEELMEKEEAKAS